MTPSAQRRELLAALLVHDAVDRLDPAGDFPGSSEYRRMLAGVLTRRVLEEVG